MIIGRECIVDPSEIWRQWDGYIHDFGSSLSTDHHPNHTGIRPPISVCTSLFLEQVLLPVGDDQATVKSVLYQFRLGRESVTCRQQNQYACSDPPPSKWNTICFCPLCLGLPKSIPATVFPSFEASGPCRQSYRSVKKSWRRESPKPGDFNEFKVPILRRHHHRKP